MVATLSDRVTIVSSTHCKKLLYACCVVCAHTRGIAWYCYHPTIDSDMGLGVKKFRIYKDLP